MSKRKDRHGKGFQVYTGPRFVLDAIDPVTEVINVACVLRFMAEAVPLWSENGDYDYIAAKGLRLSLEGVADRLEIVSAALAGKPVAAEAD